jgi:hypothetical protein
MHVIVFAPFKPIVYLVLSTGSKIKIPETGDGPARDHKAFQYLNIGNLKKQAGHLGTTRIGGRFVMAIHQRCLLYFKILPMFLRTESPSLQLLHQRNFLPAEQYVLRKL